MRNEMAFFAYMLRCCDGSYYVGHTDNIECRISQHQLGKFSGYTAIRLPVELVWMESFDSRDAAFVVERKIKGWSRKKKEALMRKDWQAIAELSKNKQDE